MKLGGRIDISIVFLCIVRILSLLLMIPHDSYFVQVNVTIPCDHALPQCHAVAEHSTSMQLWPSSLWSTPRLRFSLFQVYSEIKSHQWSFQVCGASTVLILNERTGDNHWQAYYTLLEPLAMANSEHRWSTLQPPVSLLSVSLLIFSSLHGHILQRQRDNWCLKVHYRKTILEISQISSSPCGRSSCWCFHFGGGASS